MLTPRVRRIMVKKPDHPNAARNGFISRSRLVASNALGRPLLPGEEVHHINQDPSDDRPENLLVLPRKQHKTLHAELQAPGTVERRAQKKALTAERMVARSQERKENLRRGPELKTARQAARVSQADVAAHLGVNQTLLCRMEKGTRPITPAQFHSAMGYIVDRAAAQQAEFARVTGGPA